MRQRRILVVGGGITGLTLARALSTDGHSVTVVEQAPRWAPVGAGITLAGNALAILDRLGVGPAIRAAGRRIGIGDVTDAAGRPLLAADLADRHDLPALGDFWALHRGDLHAILLGAADAAEIVTGCSVATITERGEQIETTLSDGARWEGDLLIGADGIRSAVRAMIFPEAAAPCYAGYTCWRLVVPDRIGLAQSFEMWGRGARMGLVPLQGERIYAFLVANAPPGGRDRSGALPDELLRPLFGQFGAAGAALLAALQPDDLLLRHDIDELPRHVWRRGRVALAGDAAHAMTPNLGQGAAQGIEDAYALRLALRGTRDDHAALAAYERLRARRVRTLAERSRRIGRVAQWQGPLACRLRDAILRAMPSRAVVTSVEGVIAPGLALAG
jgi:2-polyprenyl-6-methoxyphenol hydroxylase-like FAD-dependent oxidoreductase